MRRYDVTPSLREMNITVPASDEREIEVLASGLPLNHGGQLTVDITLRCALNSFGEATPNDATVNGATLLRARRDKETKYWELLHESRCQLIVVGIETDGRWSDEALRFVEQMAYTRSREAAPALRRSAFLAPSMVSYDFDLVRTSVCLFSRVLSGGEFAGD